jgi:hypothetical protein
VPDSAVHVLTDGVAVAATDEFYATRSPYGAGNDVKFNGTELAANAPVQSVFGRTGTVVAASNDYSFAQVSGVATNAQGGIGKVTLTQPATGSTLTIADGKTLKCDNTLELAGTDATKMTFPGASDTVAGLGAANAFTGANSYSGTNLFTGTLAPTLANGNATVYASAANGGIFSGQGSVNDVNITNSAGTSVLRTPTGTTNIVLGTGSIIIASLTGQIQFRNGSSSLISPANAVWQFGQADAAAPIAQRLQAQSVVAGNTNVAGVTFTIAGSKSNGSGGGDVVIQTTNTNAASGTQNTLATALTLKAGTPAGNAGDTIAAGFLQTAGFTRVSVQFDKTTDTALANVTGLSVNVIAAGVYAFRAALFVTGDAVGGQKYAMAGTCTATAIIYEVITVSNSANTIVISSKQVALGGSVGQAGSTDDFTTIEGLITVNAAGTLTVQFAQNASNGTSSVLVGSFMLVNRVA